MVLIAAKQLEISKQIEMYRLVVGTFGYEIIVQNKTTKMLNKLQVQLVSNFQISIYFLTIYLLHDANIICCLSLSFICCRWLVNKLW
jgi:hypothetical protein